MEYSMLDDSQLGQSQSGSSTATVTTDDDDFEQENQEILVSRLRMFRLVSVLCVSVCAPCAIEWLRFAAAEGITNFIVLSYMHFIR